MYQIDFSVFQLVNVLKNLQFAGIWLVGETLDPRWMKDPRGLNIFPGSTVFGFRLR